VGLRGCQVEPDANVTEAVTVHIESRAGLTDESTVTGWDDAVSVITKVGRECVDGDFDDVGHVEGVNVADQNLATADLTGCLC
jgi:hypothetical protein